MSMVVHIPDQQHQCHPGWKLIYRHGENGAMPLPAGWYWTEEREHRIGTVIKCECGKTWVAEDHPAPNVFGLVWREERRLERWCRERGEARSG